MGEPAAAGLDGSETMNQQTQSAAPARSQTMVGILSVGVAGNLFAEAAGSLFAGAAGSLGDAARESPSAAD